MPCPTYHASGTRSTRLCSAGRGLGGDRRCAAAPGVDHHHTRIRDRVQRGEMFGGRRFVVGNIVSLAYRLDGDMTSRRQPPDPGVLEAEQPYLRGEPRCSSG